MEEACAYSGRSATTLKAWVSAGKISKRMVPVTGTRPQARLSREDINRMVTNVIHVPTEVAKPVQTAVQPAQTHVALHGLAHALDRLGEIFPPRPTVQLIEKLTWTLAEARQVSGLSEPALREMIARKPDLAIRYGRRLRIKADRLRRELS